MIRQRRTRIVATLGPASRAPEMVVALARAGVDVFRLNFSHGEREDHAADLAAVRAAEQAVERPLAALVDLQGPKFRLGAFAAGAIAIRPGQTLRLDLDPAPGDRRRIPFPHAEVLRALRIGAMLLVDDGKVRLKVKDVGSDFASVEVIAGETLSDRKGVAAPGLTIPTPALTAKDRTDLDFALRAGVDWVALSFVQSAADMAELHQLVNGRAAILAKIEKPAALRNLEAILDASDGLMVARGDLGVEMAPEEVPVAQKTIVRAARRRGAPVIIATQMLDSMTVNPQPTRAEASDVANGVYEGADALMLSGESAIGAYPTQAVAMMDAIIRRVEADPLWQGLMRAEHGEDDDEDVDALIAAATRAAEARSTACLVAYTTTGATAKRLARERPDHPILAIAPEVGVARRLCLVWGVEPRVASQPRGVAAMTDEAAHMASDLGLAESGARVLIIAGPPLGAPRGGKPVANYPCPTRKERRSLTAPTALCRSGIPLLVSQSVALVPRLPHELRETMDQPADFRLEQKDQGAVAVLSGDWTAVDMGWANERLGEALKGKSGVDVDLTGVGRCDTSGAWGVIRAVEQSQQPGRIIAPPATSRLIDLVRHAIAAEPTPVSSKRSFFDLFVRLGRGVVELGINVFDSFVFNGHLLVAVTRAARNPRRIRWAAVFSLAERAGLDAIPIVGVTTFFIGAVVGLLGANMLSKFGAQVFAVELVGFSVLREFNILITALLLAGRSASSFAAEIGAMKMNQEIDAMHVLGVDPFDALVFPRFMALLLTIPLLTFVATLAGLAGGLAVSWAALGLGPTAFIQRLVDNVGVTSFWVGMSKAPVMAVVIAGIGCRQGLDVGGDVESLGRRVTAAVVHAIFAAILIDAVFALVYMELGI